MILHQFWRLLNESWPGFKWDLVRKFFSLAARWQWLDRALFMAPFHYDCLGIPQFPSAYFMVSLEISTPSFDSGFLSQTYFKNKADDGMRLPTINQASALKRTTSNPPLPAPPVSICTSAWFFQNAPSSALPLWTLLLLRPDLGSTFLLPWKPSSCLSLLLCTYRA